MVGNLSLLSLRIGNSLSQSPMSSGGCRSFTPILSVADSAFSRFSHSLINYQFSISVYAKTSEFSNFVDTCAVISSVANGNFSTYQSFSSNTTVVFTSCLFHDISSSNPSTALYIEYSSCNATITSCTFQKLVCTYSGGYSSGGITVRSCNWVCLSANYFTQCASNDPTIYQIAPHYSSSVYNCAVNTTTEYNTGVYSGTTSTYSGMAGGTQYICLSSSNHSAVKVSGHNCGHCIAVAPMGNSYISNMLIFNCSGTSFWCAIYCTHSFSVSRSIFINCTASTGITEFFYSTMSICFSQCAFVSLSAVSLSYAYTSGFGMVVFDRCCVDTPISATFLSIHVFISTISGECVIERSNTFSAIFAYGANPNMIFPLILAGFLCTAN